MKRFAFIINLFVLVALFSCNGVEVGEEEEEDMDGDFFIGACFSVRDAEGHDLLDTLYAGHFDIESIVVNYDDGSRNVWKQRNEEYDSLVMFNYFYDRLPLLRYEPVYCEGYVISCGFYLWPAETKTISVDWPDGSSDTVLIKPIRTATYLDYKRYLNGEELQIHVNSVIELVK